MPATCKEVRSSGVCLCWTARQKLSTRSKTYSPLTVFPYQTGTLPLQQPRGKTESVPGAVRLICQATKSTKTTAQSQTVNTSADGPLLSACQARKLFLEHCQQLGENKYLSMYVYTAVGVGWGGGVSNNVPTNWHKIP